MSTLTGTRARAALAVAVVGQTLVLLDNTILNIAADILSDPVRGIGASSTELAWSISAYSLMFAALTLTGGALTDRFGPQAVLVTGVSVLALASVAAALATAPVALIAARGVMGAGGGLVTRPPSRWPRWARGRGSARGRSRSGPRRAGWPSRSGPCWAVSCCPGSRGARCSS